MRSTGQCAECSSIKLSSTSASFPEGTGLGWKTEATILAKDLAQPTTCKMKRPDQKS